MFLLTAFCVAVSSPAYAEIADKEPTIPDMWWLSAKITVVAFALSLWRPWLALAALLFGLIGFSANYSEVNDPTLGLREEMGDAYVFQSYLSAGAGIAGPCLAFAVCWYLRFRRRQRTRLAI